MSESGQMARRMVAGSNCQSPCANRSPARTSGLPGGKGLAGSQNGCVFYSFMTLTAAGCGGCIAKQGKILYNSAKGLARKEDEENVVQNYLAPEYFPTLRRRVGRIGLASLAWGMPIFCGMVMTLLLRRAAATL